MSEPKAPATEAVPDTAAATPPPSPGPGALLRQARERAGLGVEDLAGQLKIASNTLAALERDDFAALSEPVYVRGYYRKIARVLAVPEKDVIDAYGRCRQPVSTAPAMGRIPLAGGVAAGTSRQYRGHGLWLVGIAAVVAAGLFAVAEREPVRRIAPTAEPVAMPPAAPVPAAEGAASPTDRVGSDTGAVSADGATADAPDGPVAAAAPEAPPAAPVAPNQLVLEFSEASFVRIEDSRAQTMAIGLVRGGERQALEGVPPYTVFLGNAHNVKVFYGGAPVDFTAHINRQNDTARFTVP